MGVSVLSQLNVEAWNSQNPVIQAYRKYADEGIQCPKKQLALAATTCAIKAVAWTALSLVGAVFTIVSLGYIENHAWRNARVNGALTKASVYALFYFEPAMQELRVKEAQSYFRASINMSDPALLIEKLKKLDDKQLKAVLDFAAILCAKHPGALATTLRRLRQHSQGPLQTVVHDALTALQRERYTKNHEVICFYNDGALFLRQADREALEAVFQDLKPAFKAV